MPPTSFRPPSLALGYRVAAAIALPVGASNAAPKPMTAPRDGEDCACGCRLKSPPATLRPLNRSVGGFYFSDQPPPESWVSAGCGGNPQDVDWRNF